LRLQEKNHFFSKKITHSIIQPNQNKNLAPTSLLPKHVSKGAKWAVKIWKNGQTPNTILVLFL